MNQGLEILIARTKTHPQEFFGWETGNHIASRWVTMMENFTNHMTDAEKEKWQEAMTDLNKWYENKRRDDFTEAVMKELLVREGEEEIGAALYSMSHPKKPRPTKLLTAASLTKDALAILAGGGGGGGGRGNGGGYGGGGSSYAGSGGSVVVKTPTGTHTFTKNGVVTVEGDEQVTWLPKP
jgi:uncharacterized membrane protein YgcG